MSYASWAEAVDVVKGEKQLQKILLPHAETAEDHDFFDLQIAIAQKIIDSALRQGGYQTPLTEPVDALVSRLTVTVMVGLVTDAMSNLEPWMQRLHAWGQAYLKAIDEGAATVPGAELSPSVDPEIEAAVLGITNHDGIFDTSDPYAEVHRVFRSLGRPRLGLGRGT